MRAILFSLIAFVALQARADQYFVGSRQFAEEIQKYQEACEQGCQKPYREALFYTNGKITSAFLSNGELKALQKIAVEQAGIWADTILEGDYYAEGNTELEEVTGIFYKSRLVAYKIQYAERAWETSSCDFDGEDVTALEGCPEGIIRETSFVSPDLKTFIRNHDDLANFYN